MESLFVIDTWQWWMFGILLILAEAVVPQVFLMWIGLSAVFTGSMAYFKPELGTVTAILIFILTSGIISGIAARLGYKTRSAPAKRPKGAVKKNQPKIPTLSAKKSVPVQKVSQNPKKPSKSSKKNPRSSKKKPKKS